MAKLKSTEVIHMRVPTAYLAQAIKGQVKAGHVPSTKTEAVKRCFYERLAQLGGEEALDEEVTPELRSILRPYSKGSYGGSGFSAKQLKDLQQAQRVQKRAEKILENMDAPKADTTDIPEDTVSMALVGASPAVLAMVTDMMEDGIDEEILLQAADAPNEMAVIYKSLATSLEPSEAYNKSIDEYQAGKVKAD